MSWDAPGIGGNRSVFINWEVNIFDYDMMPVYKVDFTKSQLQSLKNQGFNSMLLEYNVTLRRYIIRRYQFTIRGNWGGKPIFKTHEFQTPVPPNPEWQVFTSSYSTTIDSMIKALYYDSWLGGLSIWSDSTDDPEDSLHRGDKIVLNSAQLWVCK